MRKTMLLLGLNALLLGNEVKIPLNVGLDLELGIKKDIKIKYLNDITFNKDIKIFNHKVSLNSNNLDFNVRINGKKDIENIALDLETKLNKKAFEINNVFTYDYINSKYDINKIELDKYDMVFSDKLETKFKNESIEISLSPFVKYYMKNKEKKYSRDIINKKDTIKENHIRIHFDKDLGNAKDIKENLRGLWLWGYVENPSNKNDYPKNKTKFLINQKDDYGQYIDIKKRVSECESNDQNCKAKRIGYIVVDGEQKKDESGSEKYMVKEDSEIIIINDYQNEAWIKLEDKGVGLKQWNYYNYNPEYINNKEYRYLKKYHGIRKEFFENEEKIERLKGNEDKAGAKMPDFKKREQLLDDILVLRNDLSNVLNYGIDINFLYKGIKNLSLSSNVKIQNYRYFDTKDQKCFIDLNLNSKYDYTFNKLSLIPQLNIGLSFKDIKKEKIKPELILNPKIELKYALKENFSILTKLESEHIFKNKYKEIILKPSIKFKYIY